MHKWEPGKPWLPSDYTSWLACMKTPVVMLHHVPDIPTSIPYPKEEIMRKFAAAQDGKAAAAFFSSSISWMLALAIEQNPDEIGLFGVDMSAAEEKYTNQKAACQYFIGLARGRGITVTIPPQSDLDRPTPLYGYCELDPMHAKLLARSEELNARLNDATNRFKQAEMEMYYLRGAAEDTNYVSQTWVSDPLAIELLSLTAARMDPAPAEPVIETANAAPSFSDTADQLVAELRAKSNEMAQASITPVSGTSWASTKAPNYIAGA